jgi:hypothetical protein
MASHEHHERTDQSAERSTKVFFQQGCPVCGRRLEIDVNLLGRRVYCQHCGGGFVAMDSSLLSAEARVDVLLEQAALVLEQASADAATD